MGRDVNEFTRIAAVLCVFGLVVWTSDRSGVPTELPEIALGWTLLLHIERATALLGGIGIVILVGWRALRGELPIKLGHLEYPGEQATAEMRSAVASHEERIRALEARSQLRRNGSGGNP